MTTLASGLLITGPGAETAATALLVLAALAVGIGLAAIMLVLALGAEDS